MKKLIAVAALASALLSCNSKPVSLKPKRTEITGDWECTDFPNSFVTKVGGSGVEPVGTISIRDDGSIAASNFPDRDPYRFVDITGAWELVNPSITPSGLWSVEFQGNHLQCYRNSGQLILRYTISGKDEYFADYKKKPNKQQMATPRKPSD